MSTSESIAIPDELSKQLEQISASSGRSADATKVFIAIPNMAQINVGLITKLFAWARNPKVLPWYHFVTEKRWTDHARNLIVDEFLKTDCDYLGMVDADCDPHVEFIELTKHGKDIISAVVDCWINNELIPSIWQRAECEQCFCLKKFMETGEVHDPTQYYAKDVSGVLTMFRWVPESFLYQAFATREGILSGLKCRCQDTGKDPFVYRTYNQPFEPGQLVKVDSLGAAAIMIHRRVFEAMPKPYFRFYYKPSGDIMLTEDHYFCMKASMSGFEIWADFNMQCSHYKIIDLAGVKHRMIKAFEAGMQYQQKEAQKQKANIVIPTVENIPRLFPKKI